MIRRVLTTLLCVAALPAVAQDAVQLTDGRFVFDKKMTRNQEGVVIHYDSGDVLIPKRMVHEATVSTSEGVDPDQLSEKDREKLEKGYVKHKGRWIKKQVRDRMVQRQKDRRYKRIKEALDHQMWRNRYIKESKQFRFEYTIDPEVMDGYVDLMETYFKVFTKQWGIRKPTKMGKLKVCFYHDDEYYYQVSGAPRGAIGYFRFVDPIELNFYYDRIDERLTLDVMFHEANHYLTYLIDPKFRYPSWVNESLAEYYGASQWDAKKKKMSIGHLQEGRLTVIQDMIAQDKWQDLEELIRLPQGRFNANHYAWGWSFVHFLLETKKYSKSFKKFYLGLARDKAIKKRTQGDFKHVEPDEQIKALKRYLKVKKLESLQEEWYEYIRGLEPTSHRGFLRAGQVALRWDMPIKATRFFKTAIEKGSESPLAHYGLAQALSRKSKYAEAEKSFAKAVELDPLNGIYYLRLARAKVNGGADAESDEILKLRQLALEVDPDNHTVILEVGTDEFLRKLREKDKEKAKAGDS